MGGVLGRSADAMWVMTDDSTGPAVPDVAGVLAGVLRGDDVAWRDLVRLYGRRVFALAKSRCRDDDLAEEITQSVFVTVASTIRRGGYAEQGKFESWLFRIAMNRLRDEMRRRSRQAEPTDPTTLVISSGDDTSAPVHEADPEVALLRRSMAELGDADREVVELRHHAQMSFKSIADHLGQPLGTVLARHHRALRKLKELMELAQARQATQGGDA